MTDTPRFLSGTSAIAKALGVSRVTVLRMIRAGKIETYRSGDHTSPHRIERKAIEGLRREGKR